MEGLRNWLAFGTGVGVEVGEQELQVTIVRVRRAEAAVLGSATVTDYKTRPAAEWGAELTAFLRKVGAAHIAATVLLPRRDVIVRAVQLPGVADRDLEAAIRLQIDSLHPFTEDEVYFSWARVGKTASVLVGVVRREIVDALGLMFAEAGVKVASFTFSAAALHSAIRLRPGPAPSNFVVAHQSPRELEIYGESEARPVFSASFPIGDTRALGLAKSELRLEPDLEPQSFVDLLPKPAVFPDSYNPETDDFSAHVLPYATALAGACPWLSLDGNVLPADKRRASSRVRLIPTFALGSLLVLLLGGLTAESRFADSRYLNVLQREISRFEPAARKVVSLDSALAETRRRTQVLDDYRRRPKYDMDALLEVTKLIPPPGWVANFDLDRTTLQIAGESEQAAGLLKTLDNSPLFERSEFTMPITRTPGGDAFRVRLARSVGVPPISPARASGGQGSTFLPMGLDYQPIQPVVAPAPAIPIGEAQGVAK